MNELLLMYPRKVPLATGAAALRQRSGPYNARPMHRSPDDDPEHMVTDAIAKARKLVRDLERQQAEVEANPPQIAPEQLAEGRRAFENALSSARRMLKALEEASELTPSHKPELS